jgi:hypothetical protein
VDRSADQVGSADRARWLAELAEAIDQAQRVAWALGIVEGNDPEAKELYGRLESVRVEVESLRHGRWTWQSKQIDPDWTAFLSTRKPLFNPVP